MNQGVSDKLQIWPAQGRVQIGARRTGSPAPAPGLLAPADTVPGAGWQVVYILAILQSELLASFDDRCADRRLVHFRGEQGTVLAPNSVAFPLPPFSRAEERQAVIPRPTAIAELSPVVVILRLAADVYQAVDGGGAADHPAPRINNGASVGAGIGLGAKLPGQGWMVEHLKEAGW